MAKIELLSPAGDLETLKRAIDTKCDAVYIAGYQYGARKYAKNFSMEELDEAVKYAHLYNVLVYVTVNTIIFESEIRDFIDYIDHLMLIGVDALIMQDLGMINLVLKRYPTAVIHASTQAHNHNKEGLQYLKDLGVKRVVLDRELSLNEIKDIDVSIEKEVFIHGALCVSYSGECLMSALSLSRSGNRGECAGLCRLPYNLYKNDKSLNLKEKYLLSLKELNTSKYIGDILNSNVDSLKIEGRMKSPYYVEYITKVYRRLIDEYETGRKPVVTLEEEKNMALLYNRKFTKGFINLEDKKEMQTSVVVMNPNNGEVIALAGGKDYSKSQYNRAVQSKRQVGSTMKPILYYAALENGLTASTTFLSKPTTFTLDNGLSYSPNNYGNIYPKDKITMALAICYSDNIYAIKTHLFLGEDMMIKYAKKMGIKSKLEANASLPLGTNELSILEFTNAYATLANSGYRVKEHLIKKIEDGNGNTLYEYKNKKDKVLNKSYTYILSELLSNTYDTSLKSYTSPTCASIKPKLTKKYAVKSGTTDYDLWTVGYNPNIVVGVWTGYDDNRKLSNKEYKYSKNIWADVVESYLREKEAKWYAKPDNVVGVLTDVMTGNVASNDSKLKTILYYIKGTEPGYKNNKKITTSN